MLTYIYIFFDKILRPEIYHRAKILNINIPKTSIKDIRDFNISLPRNKNDREIFEKIRRDKIKYKKEEFNYEKNND